MKNHKPYPSHLTLNRQVEIVEEIELNASVVALRSDGIMHLTIRPNHDFTLQDAKDIVAAVGKIGKGKKFLNLITVGEYTIPEKEVREYAASEEGSKYTIAGAFVISSLAQKLLGNFYLKVNKPVTPTKMTNSEKEALKWLKRFERTNLIN